MRRIGNDAERNFKGMINGTLRRLWKLGRKEMMTLNYQGQGLENGRIIKM